MISNKLFVILCITLIFLTSFSESSAQVIEGDVTLASQAEVDSFMGTSITGVLFIGNTRLL